jgi:hypothetical protein
MKKVELETVVKGFDEATKSALREIRGNAKQPLECKFCFAGIGKQHYEWCVVWPLILARAALRLAEEPQ